VQKASLLAYLKVVSWKNWSLLKIVVMIITSTGELTTICLERLTSECLVPARSAGL
jgi:hypothetical protein